MHEDKKDGLGVIIYSRDYGYDSAGNRVVENRDGQNITYAVNDWNQIVSRTSSSETIICQYDDNGNLISETSTLSGTKTFSYDYENRLTNFTHNSSLIIYNYSGDGRRISVDNNGMVVKYIYDGMVPVAERDVSGTTLAAYTKIPYAPGGIGGMVSSTDGTNTVYYHCSHLGNVNLITDSVGNVIQAYDYDAFGNIVSLSGSLENEYSYKTKEYSANTGLVYFGARYYNPLIGRFITADPLGMVDGANLYGYCANDPVNFIDSYGLCWADSIADYFRKSIDQLSDPEFLAMVDDLAMGMALGTAGGRLENRKVVEGVTRSLAKEATWLKAVDKMSKVVIPPKPEPGWLKIIRIIATKGKKLPETVVKVPK